MFGRLFPKTLDNAYRGHWLALVILGLLLFLRLMQTGLGLVDPVSVIRGPDGILFDTFNAPAQAAFAYVFRLLCFLNVLVCLIGLLALLRYRAMVPLVFLILLALLAGQKAIALLYPIPRAPEAFGGMIILIMAVVTLFGFVVSLLDRPKR
jgi:hypothetical protein